MKLNIRLIILYIYSFILIYSPNLSYLIKINNFILYVLFTMLYLLKYGITKDKKIFKYFKYKPVFIFIILTMFSSFYFAIRTIFAGTNALDIYNLRIIQNLMPILYLVGTIIVYNELTEMEFTKKEKYKFIINIAFIQSLISISMIFITPLRNIALNIFYSNHNFNQYISNSRLYGICDGDYTYSFQILHGILALFTLSYSVIYREKKYFILTIFILIVTLLNGRFGLIIFIIGTIFIISYYAIHTSNFVSIFKLTNLILATSILMLVLIYNFLPNTYSLISHAYEDIILSITKSDTNSETTQLINMIFFPAGLALIFGKGFRVFGKKGTKFGFYRGSDVGYVNDIFMGGIIYISLLYSTYLSLVRQIIKNTNKVSFERVTAIALVLSAALANVKGEVFRSQLLTTILIVINIFMLLEIAKEREVK